jgi:hypothetical protein
MGPPNAETRDDVATARLLAYVSDERVSVVAPEWDPERDAWTLTL